MVDKNISKIRDEKNLTIQQLSDISSVNIKYLSGREEGYSSLSLRGLIKIAEALDVNIMELIKQV